MPINQKGAVVSTLFDKRVIAQGYAEYVVDRTGDVAVAVRVPDLRMVEYVLNVQFHTNPSTYVESGYANKKIVGNVVGMTVYGVAAATTLGVEVIAIGPP